MFLAVFGLMLYFGFVAPPGAPNDRDRNEARFVSCFCTVTSLLWFYFGSIEWTSPVERLNRDPNSDEGPYGRGP